MTFNGLISEEKFTTLNNFYFYVHKTTRPLDHRGLGGLVVGPLVTRAKGPGFNPPTARAHSEIYFSGLNVRRGWFI